MPSVSTNSLYSLKYFSSYLGVSCQNQFWYLTLNPPDTISAQSVVAAFESLVATNWEAAVSDEWTGVRVVCDEVTSNQNFFDSTTNIGPGTQTGDALAPQSCAGIRMLRVTKDTRSGWKRVVGLVESQVADGKLTAGAITAFNLLGTGFITNLVISTEIVAPVIVRKTYTGDPPILNPPSQWIYNDVASRITIPDVTSQNSRKFARGT